MDELLKKIDNMIDAQKEILLSGVTDNPDESRERDVLSGMLIIRVVVTIHMQLLNVKKEQDDANQ